MEVSSVDAFLRDIQLRPLQRKWKSWVLARKRKRIPRVPQVLLAMKVAHLYFQPVVVSLGPYHHGNPKYEGMEPVKRKMAAEYFQRNKKPVKDIYNMIRNMIEDVRDYYEEHATDRFDDGELAFMMLLDGAFLLELNSFSDPSNLDFILHDMVLLENQIPLPVIKVIIGSDDFNKTVILHIRCPIYLTFFPFSPLDLRSGVDHPLHYVEMTLSNKGSVNALELPTLRNNVTEIVAKGIRLKAGNLWEFGTASFRSHYIRGELIIPSIEVKDLTLISNLIAYEISQDTSKCQHAVTSYICFLNLLIDRVEDVLVLMSADIILPSCRLANNEEIFFKFVKEMAPQLRQRDMKYWRISRDIAKHVNTKWKANMGSWMVEVGKEYFKSPWSGTAVLAGFVLFFLAVTQTYFTVFPRK